MPALKIQPDSVHYENRLLHDPFFGQAMRFCLEQLPSLQHKKVVEIGFGNGEVSVLFALYGADVVGIDPNEQAVTNAYSLASRWGVSDRCQFLTGFAENIELPDNTVDVVFSRSTMQYIDRSRAIPECIRILKLKGTLILIENLPHNPFINLYRFVRRLRANSFQEKSYLTSIKGYFTQKELDNLRMSFVETGQREYHLLRMFSLLLSLDTIGNYNSGTLISKLDKIIGRMDTFLFTHLIFLKKYAWFVCFVGNVKKK